MKPIIVYDIEKYDGDDNMLLIDKNKFEKLLDDTYQAGYNDGISNKSGLYYPNNTRDFKPDWTVRPDQMPTYQTEITSINTK